MINLQTSFQHKNLIFIKIIIILSLLSLQSACSSKDMFVHIEDSDNHSSRWINNSNGKEIEIVTSLKGEIKMNRAETDVLSFPLDSDLYISIDDDDGTFIVRVKRKSRGDFTVLYQDGKNTLSREEVDEKRLQYAWQLFFRTTGINAASRVESIFQREGIPGVIEEIKAIRSNTASRIYIEEMVSKHSLTNAHMLTSIDLAKNISSNGNKAKAFSAIFDGKRALTQAEVLAFIEATSEITSNSRLSTLLIDTMQHSRFSNYNQEAYQSLLNASKSISSNSKLAEFLLAFVDETKDQDFYVLVMNRASTDLTSNSKLYDLFEYILEKDINQRTLSVLIDSATSSIRSSSKLASVLKSAMNHQSFDTQLVDQMRSAIKQVDSSSKREDLLDSLLQYSAA